MITRKQFGPAWYEEKNIKSTNYYKTKFQIENNLKLCTLGEISYMPIFKQLRKEKISMLPHLAISEHVDFLNIYNSLVTINKFYSLKSLMLASSLRAHGKSLITILLAKIFSTMGQRVLLIDTDLRNPCIRHRLRIKPNKGLSDLLTYSELNWKDLIYPISDNLKVISEGQQELRPREWSDLLCSIQMDKLMNSIHIDNSFDIILYDTATILGLNDSNLIAKNVDGVILLTVLNYIDCDLIKETLVHLKKQNAFILGSILNNLPRQKLVQNLV